MTLDFKSQFVPLRRAPLLTSVEQRRIFENKTYIMTSFLHSQAAQDIAALMGMPCGKGKASAELKEAHDHMQLLCATDTEFKRLFLYPDGSVIRIDHIEMMGIATQMVYSPNGDVESLVTLCDTSTRPFHLGYDMPFDPVSINHNCHDLCQYEQKKAETVFHRATEIVLQHNPKMAEVAQSIRKRWRKPAHPFYS